MRRFAREIVPPLPTVAVAGVGGGLAFLGALRALGLDEDDALVVSAVARKLGRR